MFEIISVWSFKGCSGGCRCRFARGDDSVMVWNRGKTRRFYTPRSRLMRNIATGTPIPCEASKFWFRAGWSKPSLDVGHKIESCPAIYSRRLAFRFLKVGRKWCFHYNPARKVLRGLSLTRILLGYIVQNYCVIGVGFRDRMILNYPSPTNLNCPSGRL